MTSSCHSPSLIPSPDSLYPRSESYMRVKRGKRNQKNGKRSILTKARSEVKFKDNMQRDALFRGIPFCRSIGEEHFVPPVCWNRKALHTCSYLACRVLQYNILRSKRVSLFVTPPCCQKCRRALVPPSIEPPICIVIKCAYMIHKVQCTTLNNQPQHIYIKYRFFDSKILVSSLGHILFSHCCNLYFYACNVGR